MGSGGLRFLLADSAPPPPDLLAPFLAARLDNSPSVSLAETTMEADVTGGAFFRDPADFFAGEALAAAFGFGGRPCVGAVAGATIGVEADAVGCS